MASLRRDASDDEGSCAESEFTDIEEEAVPAVDVLAEDEPKPSGADAPAACGTQASPSAHGEKVRDEWRPDIDNVNNAVSSIASDVLQPAPQALPEDLPEVTSASCGADLPPEPVASPPAIPDINSPTNGTAHFENRGEDKRNAGGPDVVSPSGSDDSRTLQGTPSNDSPSDKAASGSSEVDAAHGDEAEPDAASAAGTADSGRQAHGKPLEPYEVPSFGYHFFLHDDRYVGRGRRGRGRGRGSQLWDKDKDSKWAHDGFDELVKNDTAPPRMVDTSYAATGSRFRRGPSRDGEDRERGSAHAGRGQSGRGRGRGRDVHTSHSHVPSDEASVLSAPGAQHVPQAHPQGIANGRSGPGISAGEHAWGDDFPTLGSGRGPSGRQGSNYPDRGLDYVPGELNRHEHEVRTGAGGRRGYGRGAPGRHHPTFYGRDAVAREEPECEADGHAVGQPAATAEETPAGGRRYLANRGQSGHASAQADTVAAATLTMVPMHRNDDLDAQNVHFNPNAPGFLPMGGELSDVGAVEAIPAAAGPGPLAEQGGASHSQAPTRYLSPATAKGVMLHNELQSMMAIPQGAVPVAPMAAHGYLPGQMYYAARPPVEPVQGVYAAQPHTAYVTSPGMTNSSQHMAISPAAYTVAPAYGAGPGGRHMPQYASYMIDPNVMVGPSGSGSHHMM